MERRIDHLEDRLRALSGALRLRGVWRDPAPPDPPSREAPAAARVPRLRSSTGGGG